AGENGRPFAAPSDIHEANYEWLGNAAEADATHRMKCLKRIARHFMKYPAGLEEGCKLKDAGGVHDGQFEDAGSQIEFTDRRVVVYVAAGSEPTQRLLVVQE